MPYDDLLENYRNQIDTIDFEIIYLLSRRFQIVEEIGKIKKEQGIDAYQPDRWKQLMDKLLEEADDKQVNPQLVEELWKRIHEESLRREK